MRFLTWLVTNAIALAVATWLINGIYFTGPTSGMEEARQKIVPLILVALVLGVITSFVKPVLKVLSIPFIIVTLGLFLLVINALLLLLTGFVAGHLGLRFHVTGFWPAVGGAILITLTTWIVDSVLGDGDR